MELPIGQVLAGRFAPERLLPEKTIPAQIMSAVAGGGDGCASVKPVPPRFPFTSGAGEVGPGERGRGETGIREIRAGEVGVR